VIADPAAHHSNSGTVVEFVLPGIQCRSELLAKNPVAAAHVFETLVKAFMDCLLGMPVHNSTRKSHTNTKEGLLGIPTASYGVCECQGRGSLHVHFAVWGGATPALLQRVAHDPDLAARVAEVLDSQMQAKFPQWVTQRLQSVAPWILAVGIVEGYNSRRSPMNIAVRV
jgi:hypothetical protein